MDANRRWQISESLIRVWLLLEKSEDYLEIYVAWDKARRAMDDFMDNPDWLEKWVNETAEQVEICSE